MQKQTYAYDSFESSQSSDSSQVYNPRNHFSKSYLATINFGLCTRWALTSYKWGEITSINGLIFG